MTAPSLALSFHPINIPGARPQSPTSTLPLALQYSPISGAITSLEQAVEDIKALPLDELLAKGGGALLLRGLPIKTPDEISKAILAFGAGEEYLQVGIAGKRSYVAEELQTANEGPPTLRFYQHNEWARFSYFPSKIFFACQTFRVKSGGETPLTSSVEVFKRLYDEIPELIEELFKRGLVSKQLYPAPGQEGSDNAFNWRQKTAFGADILAEDDLATARAKAEKRASIFPNSTVEWSEDGALILKMGVPAIRRVNDGGWKDGKGTPTFFNGLTGRFGMILQRNALNPPHIGTDGMKYLPPTYGDGTPIPQQYLFRLLEIQDELTVLVPWQEGDIVYIDNFIVQHGRVPWVGAPEDRVILCSLRNDGNELIPF